VEIRVFREDASGARTDTGGVTVAGTPVQIGVRAKGYVVRDVKIRLSYRVESGRMHTYVVKLGEGTRFADGQERRSIRQQIADLEALRNPGSGGGAPVAMRRPDGVETYGEVVSVRAQEVSYKGEQGNASTGWVAVLQVREAAYS
jgi:hypothetical protein